MIKFIAFGAGQCSSVLPFVVNDYDSGLTPEDIYANFVRNYEGYWIEKYKEVISEVVEKIESFRLKFEKQDGYMAVEFFEDVMKYQRELEEKLK